MIGCVVTQQDDLGPLQSQHPVGLDPAAIVANAHAHDAAECSPDGKAKIADVKIQLLQVLERMLGMEFRAAGEMNLAVLAYDLAVRADEHAGVVATLDAGFDGELRVAKVEANAQTSCLVKERLRDDTRHLAL